MKTRFAKHGFTMVELLVVITIIVILAAILFPAVQSMRTKGMRTKTEEILKKVESAIKLYSNDMGHCLLYTS
ncbi:MAG: type II secretion system GspH family protein, partial [Planctomycetota bacterium]|nr:type II secretion system GspH family protein [Planctomycetota bacterium]